MKPCRSAGRRPMIWAEMDYGRMKAWALTGRLTEAGSCTQSKLMDHASLVVGPRVVTYYTVFVSRVVVCSTRDGEFNALPEHRLGRGRNRALSKTGTTHMPEPPRRRACGSTVM